jgi:hypothetical protein
MMSHSPPVQDVCNTPSIVSDAQLIAAMRTGSAAAWRMYEARFKPILETHARRSKIPHWDWPVCITEVLEDEGIRWSGGDAVLPANIAAYLIAAVRHRYMRLKRAQSCRERKYAAATDDCYGERVVSSLCSVDAIRSSRGPGSEVHASSDTLFRLVTELRAGLTGDEETILVWVSERVPHRQIATWLGTSHGACTKRIWRLCRRLRRETRARRGSYSGAERVEIDRLMRRAEEKGGAGTRSRTRETKSHGRRPAEAQRSARLAG